MEINKKSEKEFEQALINGEQQFRGPQKIGVALIFASLITSICVGYMGLKQDENQPRTIQKADSHQKPMQKNIQNQRM